MQAIKTAYLPPTNVKGSRVKASCAAGSITLHWDDRLNSDGNHRAAAIALLHKLGWQDYGNWFAGWIQTRQDNFCVWVCDNAQSSESIKLAA